MNGAPRARSVSILGALLLAPLFLVYAANDVSVINDVNFDLNTFDTSVPTTIIASGGPSEQVTQFDAEPNYINITLDSASHVTFTTTVGGQYFSVAKASGSNDYTVSPSCPTTTVTMTGTGAQVVLQLKVLTTNGCPPPPSGGGGGGGGGGGAVYIPPPVATTTPPLPVATTTPIIQEKPTPQPVQDVSCGPYLLKYIKTGDTNDPTEVKKLQDFLMTFEGEAGLSITGVYGPLTVEAVKRFQVKYGGDVLGSWGLQKPTGWVYQTTTKKINELYCKNTKKPVLLETPEKPVACSPYLLKYIKIGAANDSTEVKKLQSFLIAYEGEKGLSTTGVYGPSTLEAVKRFQAKYNGDVLSSWSLTAPTGYVYKTTLKKVNELYCKNTQ